MDGESRHVILPNQHGVEPPKPLASTLATRSVEDNIRILVAAFADVPPEHVTNQDRKPITRFVLPKPQIPLDANALRPIIARCGLGPVLLTAAPNDAIKLEIAGTHEALPHHQILGAFRINAPQQATAPNGVAR